MECNCQNMCFPDGIKAAQKHHENCALTRDWLNKCVAEFMRRTCWTKQQATNCAEACLENLEYDITECPIDAVSEEISYWSD